MSTVFGGVVTDLMTITWFVRISVSEASPVQVPEGSPIRKC